MSLRGWLSEPFKAEAHLMALLMFGPTILSLVVGIMLMLYLSHCSPAP